MFLNKQWGQKTVIRGHVSQGQWRGSIPLAGGGISFLGTAGGTFSFGTGFFGTAGTLKTLVVFLRMFAVWVLCKNRS